MGKHLVRVADKMPLEGIHGRRCGYVEAIVKKGTIMMKSHFRFEAIAVAICGIAFAVGVFSIRARADQWDKKTTLTIDQPIQVQDTFLEPGKYVFRLLDSSSDRHVVQIFNGDQTHIISTILAIPNYQVQPTGRSQFMFYETPPGTARAMRAWFYPGDNFGQEFTYPKNLHTLEVAAVTSAPAPAAVAPPPPPVTQPEAKVEERQPEPQPAEMAAPPQANPAPAPEPQTQAAPPPEPPPANLPHTASPYSLFGLGGVFSLGLYALVRLMRAA
jgi:hypothetical protein